MKSINTKSMLIAIIFLLLPTLSWADEPDRDFGVHIRSGDLGAGVSIYFTDNIGMDYGYSLKLMTDKAFELDGFTPFAFGSFSIRAGAMLGLFWEQTATRGLLLEQDEISWRIAARFRHQLIYQTTVQTTDFFGLLAETVGEEGTVNSYPITAGIAYTWWALPWEDSESWWSDLLDFGIVFRIEAGPDFASYDLERQPFESAGTEVAAGESQRVKDFKTEFYWNFQMGIVL